MIKKKFIQLIPILVIILASTGFSIYKKNSHNDQQRQYRDNSNGQPYRKCETCPPQQSCNRSCIPICGPCKKFDNNRKCEICPPCQSCCTEIPSTGEPCNCAYNAPGRIDPACGLAAWLIADFIYWLPKEKGLTLGYHYDIQSGGEVIKTIDMDYDYHPGFKVGLGFSTDRDDWTLYAEYTRLNIHEHSSIELPFFSTATDFLLDPWLDSAALDSFQNISAKWDLDYNIFDLELGRPYYVGRKVIFNPIFGLKAGWIDQDFHKNGVGYTTDEVGAFVNVNSISKQKTWFIGPKAGVNTDWLLGCYFKIFGNVAASLLYQNFDINYKNSIEESSFSSSSCKKISYLNPVLDFSLGLGYGRYFCNSQWHFDFTIGYDFHYFWNQNMMRNLLDGQSLQIDGDAGNLMLHGLTVSARLDF